MLHPEGPTNYRPNPQDVITAARKYVALGRRSYYYLGGGAWNIGDPPRTSASV
jgi:hypothetical protein